MSARLLNGPRPFFVILGGLVALAPGLASGCGGSSATSGTDASTHQEGGITVGTVMTMGGGVFDATTSTGMVVNPFAVGPSDDGGPTPDDSGAGDGSGLVSDASGSSSGSSSSSSGASSSSSSGGSSSSSGGSNVCESYMAPLCGTTPCDLHSNTCCIQVNIDLSLDGTCVSGANATCPSNDATVHCLQACECGGPNICCGVMNKLFGLVTSECQSIASLADGDGGGLECNPYPQTNTQASAQLCKTDGECENGAACVAQTCVYGAMLSICGVQSQSPFNCAPTN